MAHPSRLQVSVAESTRLDGMDCGYSATKAKTFIPNPYEPGSSLFNHWADGYDLGVLQARDSIDYDNDN